MCARECECVRVCMPCHIQTDGKEHFRVWWCGREQRVRVKTKYAVYTQRRERNNNNNNDSRWVLTSPSIGSDMGESGRRAE